jgi:signal transduction histidine kinase
VYSTLTRQAWKPKGSVKIRFAVIQGFFIAMVVSLLALTLYFTAQNRLISISNQSYSILAENLAASVYPNYVNGKRQEIINSIRMVEKQVGVKYVLLIEQNGTVYYDTYSGDQSLEGKQFPPDSLSKQAEKGNSAIGKVTRDGTTYYNFVAPFSTADSGLIIRLGIDQEAIDGQFIRLAQLFIYMAIFSTILGIYASYLLADRLTKPIIKLTESALAIRAGNLNAYPDIHTNDELEQLSREFQNMVEKLKQFYFQEFTQKKQALEAKKRLEEINERLKGLDRQKTDFLNAASHQLRTPLSVIHWSLSMIVDSPDAQKLPKDQFEMLKESLGSTKRMVDLVNQLLDISRIEQGRREMNWGKANFGAVCAQLTNSLKILAQNKNLELTYTQKGEIPDSFFDEKAFYQIVNNFVDNAIKYTAQGYVRVSSEQVGNTVHIVISDSGIGMTDEEKKRLFTRFSRGDDAQKMFPNGSGLGMYVAQSLLKQHGGSIEVESEKGMGTTFTLILPIYERQPDQVVDETAQLEAKAQLESGLQENTATPPAAEAPPAQ